ncbi:MAG: hypothetical protein ACXVB9_01545 [Bdellovibrionota bacterium]
MLFSRTRQQLLALVLGLLFAFQMLVVVPQHHFHASEHAAPAFGAQKSAQSPNSAPQPDDCRCDFCVAFNALDTGSVASPPDFGLVESFFAPFVSAESVLHSRAILSFRARGPPSFSV